MASDEHRDSTVDAGVAAPTLDLRAQLARLVLDDLLGPKGGPEEELDADESRVSDRYVLGMLAPRNTRLERDTDDELAPAGTGNPEEGSSEPTTAPADTTLPSSFGLTLAVDEATTRLKVTARWGRYDRIESATQCKDDGGRALAWKRRPMGGQPITLDLAEGRLEPVTPSAECPDVTIEGLVRVRGDRRIVTLFLVNGQQEAQRNKDERWLFQPELIVEATDGSPCFVRRPIARAAGAPSSETDREAVELAMLHRKSIEFAVGHGIGVHATVDADDPWRAVRVETRVVPAFEVAQQTPPTSADEGFERLAGLVLDMASLAETPDGGFGRVLSPLTDAYDEWLRERRAALPDPTERLEEHHDVALAALARCERARSRILAGIELLDRDPVAAAAFRFANRAMTLQRIRSLWAAARRQDSNPSLEALQAEAANHSWRPFQLAFILLNLPAVTDLHHAERSHATEAVADLLWFPTGGGKTEAYLGLTAYVLALRRLQGPVEGRSGEHGVAVLMRYTLRLLTIQQFQRATALICACEVLRRAEPGRWGAEPFRIGLWVGQKATPNWTADSAEVIAAYRGGGSGPGSRIGSPVQLTNCPWCGLRLERKRDFEVETVGSGRGRTLAWCPDSLGQCDFSKRKAPGEGIPVVVVDEEVYRRLPALVIATVDKFAQMPWNGRTQMLFGQVSALCPRHGFRSPEVDDADSHRKAGAHEGVKSVAVSPLRPPDLIIQDELHLISGPLGSLVGLYETAVDDLCSWTVGGKRVRPKVIASTATVRNARAQVNALFLRNVEVFPPPGTDASDNFFSLTRRPSREMPGRLYLGICAPGKRLKAVLIRTYVALLAGGKSLYDVHGKQADPWMTLLGYFNSLRELGGMRRLVDDDVATRLRKGIRIRGLLERRRPVLEELTSRKTSTDIPEILDRLELGFDPEREAAEAEAKKQGKRVGPTPYDVMLATNMVSVGVDVKRLGLMVVAGQPKATAEYIQATSRVGRHHPGLVLTVYNWARPRDLSHYERFEHYHATFYERVESLSVTPFSARALDRGLSALLVSLVRLPGTDYNANETAAALVDTHPFVTRAVEAIAARGAEVTVDKALGVEIRSQLRQRIDAWLARAKHGRLGYRRPKDGVTPGLLRKPLDGPWDTFTCLNSLRDVEPVTGIILIDDATKGDS